MKCYDCAQAGEFADAVGVCHHCGAGVCLQHCHVALEPGHRLAGVGQSTLSRPAREVTCLTCHASQSLPARVATKRNAR
ncbi:DUF2180 family protein [Streptomyces sp. NPDC056149]|uniref:DUF2180 family protein n=1 Tax=unclassified Streptomyces TaxID=2593676 RepID=UPI0023811D2D|nr:DUF2180 family protein [Streptomyces sp. WZ-12]